ncbi:putative cytochrome P450 superfamily [Arabidopsis thaliana]
MSFENAIEYIYTFFLIANETTPGILAATVKLISDHPKVMKELQREHDGIVHGKTEKEAGITWEDYKSMTFTQMVSVCHNHLYGHKNHTLIYQSTHYQLILSFMSINHDIYSNYVQTNGVSFQLINESLRAPTLVIFLWVSLNIKLVKKI